MSTTDKAQQIITELNKLFAVDSFSFSFYCSQYIAGDHNKEIRREIVKIITSKTVPFTHCGLTVTERTLSAHFTQRQLF